MAEGNVLVVDDNEMNRDMLSRRLRRQGHTVDLAGDGEEALAKMREATYQLVLLDVMMPGLNGYETLEAIKADPALRQTPVIMISAVDDLESVVKCIEMGAEDYLFKPFNPVLLKARVNASINRAGRVDLAALREAVGGVIAAAEQLPPDHAVQQATERLRRLIEDED